MTAETEQVRAWRRGWRVLFDGVADRYQDCRSGYPPELVQFVVESARLRPGSAVLEVGCGTGQLTEQLVASGLAVTAIDIGAAMVGAARRRVTSAAVSFEVAPFEAFAAPDASFEAIVSATAFHWIDPEVKFAKPARLLTAGGWLALITTGERYDDPFGAALREMWIARSEDGGRWIGQQNIPPIDFTGSARFFGPPVKRSHAQRIVLPAETVVGLESTRATFLSWPEQVRQDFLTELRHSLRATVEVPLTQETSLAMARVLPPR
jgi:ubiquinone/menaquinone biosynthesis C-methylase UbiE